MAPYWSDETVALWRGDCLGVLRGMEPASVDAIVTDPPYGLEFMGRKWDGADGFRRSLNPADADRTGSESWRSGAGMTKPGIGERPTSWPAFGGKDSANATCATCGGRMRGARKCSCAEPDWRVKGRPAGDSGLGQMWLYQEWCTAWAAECLRVLKPGAYMLCFGGTRTWHRLCSAVEDAGFEIRDHISWLYGSGFSKGRNFYRLDILPDVEQQLRDQGVTGEITWR